MSQDAQAWIAKILADKQIAALVAIEEEMTCRYPQTDIKDKKRMRAGDERTFMESLVHMMKKVEEYPLDLREQLLSCIYGRMSLVLFQYLTFLDMRAERQESFKNLIEEMKGFGLFGHKCFDASIGTLRPHFDPPT